MATPNKSFWLTWAPTGQYIGTVQAKDAKAARRKAPMPYRRFLGEIRVDEGNGPALPDDVRTWAVDMRPRTDSTGARMRTVLTLDARDFGQGDVSATCDGIRSELESRFGVRTELEATYPHWRILASGARLDEAEHHAAIYKDCGSIVARGAS